MTPGSGETVVFCSTDLLRDQEMNQGRIKTRLGPASAEAQRK